MSLIFFGAVSSKQGVIRILDAQFANHLPQTREDAIRVFTTMTKKEVEPSNRSKKSEELNHCKREERRRRSRRRMDEPELREIKLAQRRHHQVLLVALESTAQRDDDEEDVFEDEEITSNIPPPDRTITSDCFSGESIDWSHESDITADFDRTFNSFDTMNQKRCARLCLDNHDIKFGCSGSRSSDDEWSTSITSSSMTDSLEPKINYNKKEKEGKKRQKDCTTLPIFQEALRRIEEGQERNKRRQRRRRRRRRLQEELELEHQVIVSNSKNTIPSIPGAYLMRGSNVAGRAQVGMITPDSKDDYSRDSESVSLYKTDLNNDDVVKKRIVFCLLISIIFIGGIILIVVIIQKKLFTQKNSNDEVLFRLKQWGDLVKECDDNYAVDFDSMNPRAVARYLDLRQRFLPHSSIESCSPQQLALLSMALIPNNKNNNNNNSPVSSKDQEELTFDRYALSTFFFALGGYHWKHNLGWLSESHECTWEFVGCTSSSPRRVNRLILGSNYLMGSIPDEIFELASLEELDLHSNSELTGTISPAITNLTNLAHFSVWRAAMEGPLPMDLFLLPKLKEIWLPDLMTPDIAGDAADFKWPTQLNVFGFPATMWGNTIPSELGRLTNLKQLEVVGSLFGTIPEEVQTLPQMEEINIRYGMLTGTLSEKMFRSNPNWKSIVLRNNALTGPIPPVIGTQRNLQILDISSNKFSSTIPPELAKCTSLQRIDLSSNHLRGTIPTQLGSLNSLQILRLDGIPLTGTLPDEIASSTSLTSLSLSDCSGITGTIPPQVCEHQISLQLADVVCDKYSRIFAECENLPCCYV